MKQIMKLGLVMLFLIPSTLAFTDTFNGTSNDVGNGWIEIETSPEQIKRLNDQLVINESVVSDIRVRHCIGRGCVGITQLNLSFDAYFTTINNDHVFRLESDNGTSIITIGIFNGDLWWSDGSEWRYLRDMIPDRWFNFRMSNFDFNNQTFQLFVDDVAQNGTLPFSRAGNNVSLFGFGSFNAGSSIVYLDNFSDGRTMCGGSGTQADPYLICDCSDMNEMQDLSIYANYTLVNDINCSGFEYICPRTTYQLWRGEIDGAGNKIDSLHIQNIGARECCGLIGTLDDESYIHDLGLTNVLLEGDSDGCGVLGQQVNGDIARVYITGTIRKIGTKVASYGGIAKTCSGCSINDSWINVTWEQTGTAYSRVGGIIQSNSGGGLINRVFSLNSDFSGITISSPSLSGSGVGTFINGIWNNVYALDGALSFFGSQSGGTLNDSAEKSIVQLKTQSTYNNYDFNGTWAWNNETMLPELDQFYVPPPPPCVEDFVCNGYGACNSSDLSPCNSVVDNNACNTSYAGDYSEFSGQSCDFCTYSLVLTQQGNCTNGTRSDLYTDNNFASCCQVTSIPADCFFGGSATGFINSSCTGAYSAQYDADDISNIVIDLISKYLLETFVFVGLLALMAFYIFAYRQRIFVR